jgi:hypothetical protein
MANYTPITNFAAKDSLPSGDAAKKAKGTDIQAELNAIAAAILTKANTDVAQTFDENVTFNGDVSLSTVTDSSIDCGTY